MTCLEAVVNIRRERALTWMYIMKFKTSKDWGEFCTKVRAYGYFIIGQTSRFKAEEGFEWIDVTTDCPSKTMHVKHWTLSDDQISVYIDREKALKKISSETKNEF